MNSDLALFNNNKTVTSPWPKWPIMGNTEKEALANLIDNKSLSVLRKEGVVAEFEDAFAEKFGCSHALSFSSGTASIHAACFACGVGPGWEVLTPSYTWISAITAILHGNGTPVFCDVRKDTFHIDPEEIVRKATPRTKAVIVCHTWGVPAPMDEIMDAAQQKGLKVIEDASHCHGGKYQGKYLGTIGDIGCFSLQASKALSAGEGGILVTNEKLLYERAMVPGHHDMRLKQCLSLPETKSFEAAGAYWKYRAAPLEMALACSQLPHLDEWNANKLENYTRLEKQLKELSFIEFPDMDAKSERGFYSSPCLYNYDQSLVSRDTFLEALWAEGATVFPGYNENWYQTPILQDMNLFKQFWIDNYPNGTKYTPLPPGALPHTDDIVRRAITIPSWGHPVTALVDQYAAAFHKVAQNMDVLADYQYNKNLDIS
jgi:perosamine synthetase